VSSRLPCICGVLAAAVFTIGAAKAQSNTIAVACMSTTVFFLYLNIAAAGTLGALAPMATGVLAQRRRRNLLNQPCCSVPPREYWPPSASGSWCEGRFQIKSFCSRRELLCANRPKRNTRIAGVLGVPSGWSVCAADVRARLADA
jgi:hypothetical protein